MKLKYLLMGVASLGLFASCESDDPSLVVAEYHKPAEGSFVLNTPQFASGIYDLSTADKLNFTYSQPDYGYAAAVDYTVEVSNTADFAEYTAISTLFHTTDIDVDGEEFAVAVCTVYGWGSEEDIAADIAASSTGTIPAYVRVRAKISNTMITDSEIVSNVISINTVPYFALPPVEMPTVLYMAGDFCGWEWANAAEMVPVHSNEDKFWCIRHVDAGTGFKFNSERADGGNVSGSDNSTITTTVDGATASVDADGNLTVDQSGWYIFGVSVALDGRDYVYTVTLFPPNVYLYGTCAGGVWSDDPNWLFTVPSTADGEFVSPAFAAPTSASEDDGVRMCIHPLDASGSQWAGDWWHTEFVPMDGQIAYRGTGGDQSRVKAAAGQQVYLNFSTGAGRIE